MENESWWRCGQCGLVQPDTYDADCDGCHASALVQCPPHVEHDWKPLPKWQGRYRCQECGALGYRGLMKRGGRKSERGKILPYGCSKRIKRDDKRTPCPRPAVSKNERGAWVCFGHGGQLPDSEGD